MIRRSKRNRKFQWPCGTCGSECGDDTIYCDGCMVWYHMECDNLSIADLKSMSKIGENYLCSSCTKIAGFDGALSRLKTNMGSLPMKMKVEAIYLKRTPFQLPNMTNTGRGRDDVVSTEILKSSGGLHGRRPVYVSKDGNCLFNALSVSLVGNESAASELRLRTCLEMFEYKSFYTQFHQNTGIRIVSPDYTDAVRECSVHGGYSSAWTVHAAATVLGVPIRTVYPPVNGMMDKCIPILNTTFFPRRKHQSKEAIAIMWTSTSQPTLGVTWSPNHFVPLVIAASDINASVILLDESGNMSYADAVKSPLLSPKIKKQFSPSDDSRGEAESLPPAAAQSGSLAHTEPPSSHDAIKTKKLFSPDDSRGEAESLPPAAAESCSLAHTKPPSSNDAIKTKKQFSPSKDSIGEAESLTPAAAQSGSPAHIKPPSSHDAIKTKMDRIHRIEPVCTPYQRDRSLDTTYIVQKESEVEKSVEIEKSLLSYIDDDIHPLSSRPNHDYETTPSLSYLTEDVESNVPQQESHIPLGAIKSNGQFMDPVGVLNTMINRKPTSKDIPYGAKENVFFLLNNEDNVARQQSKRKALYVDDCGSWGSNTSMKTHHYLLHDNCSLQYIELRNGQYYANVKRQCVLLDPQPEEDQVVSFRRYYQKLKREETYRRRISTIVKCPETLNHVQHLAVVEYVGKYTTTCAPHGNAKTSKTDYVRTRPGEQQKINQLVETNMPRDDMLLNDSASAPRDLKQVQNARYLRQKHKHRQHHSSCNPAWKKLFCPSDDSRGEAKSLPPAAAQSGSPAHTKPPSSHDAIKTKKQFNPSDDSIGEAESLPPAAAQSGSLAHNEPPSSHDAIKTKMDRIHRIEPVCTPYQRDRSLDTTFMVQKESEVEKSVEIEESMLSYIDDDIHPLSSRPNHDYETTPSLSYLTEDVESNVPQQESHIPLGAIKSNGQFMDPVGVLNTMINRKPTSKDIPYGAKENVFFLLNNEDNVARQQSKRKALYVDDCGSWGSNTSMKTHHYLLHDNCSLQYIELRNGQYYASVKRQRVLLDPQPEEDQVVSFRRYYQKLKREETYRRRISTIVKCPETLNHVQHLAVVEYVGKYSTTCAPHGNAKTSKTDYVRTRPGVQQKINQLVETNVPRDVYTDMLLNDSASAPRDLKQVQNARYSKQKHKHGQHHRRNDADDIQTLISSFHDHPFMQEIIQTKHKNPSVILYLEDNLTDIKQFCTAESPHPCVMGVDRTFNLGRCYVTIIVYQHSNLIRKISQTHPIMLACVYLHWDGKYETYHRFFSHLQCRLNGSIDGVQLNNLVIGSDEEVALTKAIKDCFPSSQQVLDVRHLEENVGRYLRRKIGTNDKNQQIILQDIFGKDGIVQSKSVTEYDMHMSELLDKYTEQIPHFVEYFEKVSDKIRESVVKPRQSNKWIPLKWKNNLCKSMNHILKLSANGKSLKLPDLVDRLYKIVKVQQADMRRSLYGHGNYQLAPWMMKLYVRPSIWAQKSEDEKNNLFMKFMAGVPHRQKTIVSTDGLLELPNTPTTAKKTWPTEKDKE